MADDTTTKTAQDFVVSVGPAVVETQEQALAVYYQMRSYPELSALLGQHKDEIARAIQQRDPNALINIIQKVQSDFLRGLSEKAYQVQLATEQKIKEAQRTPDEITSQVNATEQALSETYKTAETVYTAKRQKNRAFIETLVKNYSRLPETESQSLTDAIVANAETYPELSPKEIIQNATKTIQDVSPEAVNKLQRNNEMAEWVEALQKNDITITEQQVIQAVLDSPEPTTTIGAIRVFAEDKTKSPELPDFIEKAQLLASASNAVRLTPDGSNIDYSGFFTNISKKGSVIEKTLAPVADTIFSLFPKDVQETIVSKVLGSSWNKEVSNNGLLQRVVGPAFQSSTIQQAIQKGNMLFESTGKGTVITKTQSFFADIFVTVFHPQVSETYLQLARIGNTQMGGSVAGYYTGFLAQQGLSYAAGKGLKVAGKAVAKKAAGTAVGKIAGTIAGGATGNPLIAIVGSFIGDKIIGGILNGAKKLFGFLTLDWLG
ncbi:MAG: hypothetical protein V1917_03110, partial [Candidatus Gottesmanbacteria bacterium]